MKKFLITVLLCVAAASASAAGDVDVRGLTPVQKAEIALQVEKLKNTPEAIAAAPLTTAAQVNDVAVDATKKWAGVGKELASGLVGAAKELGVAANEFATTPVGKITTYIIVWKLMGKDIMGIIVGGLLLLVGIPVIWYLFRRISIQSIEYEDRKGIFGRNYRVKKIVRFENLDAQTPIFVISVVLTFMVFITAMFQLPF